MEERLLNEKGSLKIEFFYRTNNRYSVSGVFRNLIYSKVYWYDGAKFLIGKIDGVGNTVMMELQTHSCAVTTQDNAKSVSDAIRIFKKKLDNRNIHVIIRGYKLTNIIYVEPWMFAV